MNNQAWSRAGQERQGAERGQDCLLHGNPKLEGGKKDHPVVIIPRVMADVLNASHTLPFLSHERNPHPELNGRGIRLLHPTLTHVAVRSPVPVPDLSNPTNTKYLLWG